MELKGGGMGLWSHYKYEKNTFFPGQRETEKRVL